MGFYNNKNRNTTKEQVQYSKKGFLEKVIDDEKNKARKDLSNIINYVLGRYENSSITEHPLQLKAFQEHNDQILDKCIEQGIQRGLNKEQLLNLEIAAVLHDLNKGDEIPKWAESINNFMVVYHGEAAAKELDANEELRELLKQKISKGDFDNSLKDVQNAIRSHMGPHPGFMSEMLKSVNKELEKRGFEKIEHPYPKKGDVVAEILLAADMYSLASSKGIKKVMAIRGFTPFFREQDKKISLEYMELGIDLCPGEAALQSAFDGAYAARDMINNEDDKKWIQEAIDAASMVNYEYNSMIDETSDRKGDYKKVKKTYVFSDVQGKRMKLQYLKN